MLHHSRLYVHVIKHLPPVSPLDLSINHIWVYYRIACSTIFTKTVFEHNGTPGYST